MIRVGVVGYGFSARTFHVPFITASEDLELVAVASSRPDVVSSDVAGVAVCRTAREMMDTGRPDLVVITAPNQAHFDLATLALQHDAHVIVEKPMVTCLDEAEKLFTLANDSSRLLTVFQNRRWDGDFLTIRKLIDDGTLGEVRYFESHFDRFRPAVQQRWKEEAGPASGLWWDLGPHLVDQALCLFGTPEAVTASLLAMREEAVTTDYFHVQLHYPRTEVVLHGSSLSAGPNRRFLVEGTAGSYTKHGLDPQEDQLRAGMLPGDPDFGVEDSRRYGTIHDASGARQAETLVGDYGRFYAAMAGAIQSGATVPVSQTDAIGLVRILETAEESQSKGQTCRL